MSLAAHAVTLALIGEVAGGVREDGRLDFSSPDTGLAARAPEITH